MEEISKKILDISPKKWLYMVKEVYDIWWDIYFSTGMILWWSEPK